MDNFKQLIEWATVEQAFKALRRLIVDFRDDEGDNMWPNKPLVITETSWLERECESLDRQIDQVVYELYRLTEEEIMVVEGK